MLRKLLAGVVALCVFAYLGLLGYIYANQRSLQYFPTGEVAELIPGILTDAVNAAIPVGDGETVNGWFTPPLPGRALIIYFKGNAGSFTAEQSRYAQMRADGYGVLAFDYRGFPASPGTISQANILEDALAVHDWAAARGFPVVLWGRSLGAAPATYVASRREVEALLLESPFLSAVNVAAERYPYLPVGWLMLDSFRTDDWIAEVDEPVLIVHGTADTVISVTNGERLYERVPNPARLWIVEGAGHSNLWDYGLWQEASRFLASALE